MIPGILLPNGVHICFDFTANRQRQERIRQGKGRPLTPMQTVVAAFLSFFESPAPAVSKQVQSLSSDSNSISVTQTQHVRRIDFLDSLFSLSLFYL